jgi:hypothetical protein
MAASIFIHSWSPHADSSASKLVTSPFAKLALYLRVRPFYQLQTHHVATKMVN